MGSSLWAGLNISMIDGRTKPDQQRSQYRAVRKSRTIENQAAGQRPQRHAQARRHGRGAHDRPDDRQRKILAHEHRIERHNPRIGEPKHDRHRIELSLLAREDNSRQPLPPAAAARKRTSASPRTGRQASRTRSAQPGRKAPPRCRSRPPP